MFEEPESGIREESGEGTGIGEETSQGGGKGGIGGQGGEGGGAEAGTDRIEQEGESEETSHDAPEDDAGTPEDEPSRTE
jgi:hypothetical protein